mgnify:CR=1
MGMHDEPPSTMCAQRTRPCVQHHFRVFGAQIAQPTFGPVMCDPLRLRQATLAQSAERFTRNE